jgi:hypothetical protein
VLTKSTEEVDRHTQFWECGKKAELLIETRENVQEGIDGGILLLLAEIGAQTALMAAYVYAASDYWQFLVYLSDALALR